MRIGLWKTICTWVFFVSKHASDTVHGSEIRQSPVEVGSASPNLRRVLAPSKRWLALGFLNHQQCWLSLNFSSSAWTNTQRHWYICIPNTLWGGTWTPKTLPKKTFSAGICKGECSLQSQVYTKDLNKSTCKTTWCFFKKFSWRNWIWEVPDLATLGAVWIDFCVLFALARLVSLVRLARLIFWTVRHLSPAGLKERFSADWSNEIEYNLAYVWVQSVHPWHIWSFFLHWSSTLF